MGPHLERTLPTPTASLVDDLEMDSLDIVELVVDIEEAFELSVPDDQADKLRTWGDVIKLVNKLVKEAREAANVVSSDERKQHADAAGA
jgi:acyl carrier protein